MVALTEAQQCALRQFIDIVAANSVNINLPEICVCGDTSSGKSSLLSALSGIIFPSDAEICTRCPTRVRLEIADHLQVKVKIIWDPNGKAYQKAEHDRSIANLKNYEECDFDQLTDKLKELQDLILEHDGCQGGVSSSLIEVSVKGPKYSNFTIIDLPGIVKTAGKNESNQIIGQIDSLLEQYLKNPRCIVLAVHPADVDYHNSEIFKRAKNYDPETRRTFPVITKADKVGFGEEKGVIKLMRNEEAPFSLGFHLVKLRSQQDVLENISIDQIVSGEMTWLKNSVFKTSIDFDSFGVHNLNKRLEKLYIKQLSDNIEDVMAEIKHKHQESLVLLHKLGPDVSQEYSRRKLFNSVTKRIIEKIENLGDSTCHPPQTEDGLVLATKRAVLEHLKHDLISKIIPEEFTDLKAGDEVTKVIDGSAVLCKVVACFQKEERDRNGDLFMTYALVPVIDSNFCSKWSLRVRSALLDETQVGKPIKGLENFADHSNVFIGPKKAFMAPDSSDDDEDETWYTLRTFPEEELFRSNKILVNSIRSRRQCAMPIFEGEAIFKDQVCRWIDNQVREAAYEFIDAVKNMIEGDSLETASARNHHELTLYNGLSVGIEEAIKASRDDWFKKLKYTIDIMLRQEMNPQTQNHYFTNTILKMRTRLLEQLILSAAQQQRGGPAVVSVAHIENVFNSINNKDIIQFVADELSISLQAYYKVARKNIIDAVSKIIDHSLQSSTRVESNTANNDYDGSSGDNTANLISFPEFVEHHLNSIDYNVLIRNQDTEDKRNRAVLLVKDLENTLKELPALKAKLAMN